MRELSVYLHSLISCRTYLYLILVLVGLSPENVVHYKSHYSEHIFSGDCYSTGYYSYIWAQV